MLHECCLRHRFSTDSWQYMTHDGWANSYQRRDHISMIYKCMHSYTQPGKINRLSVKLGLHCRWDKLDNRSKNRAYYVNTRGGRAHHKVFISSPWNLITIIYLAHVRYINKIAKGAPELRPLICPKQSKLVMSAFYVKQVLIESSLPLNNQTFGDGRQFGTFAYNWKLNMETNYFKYLHQLVSLHCQGEIVNLG